MKSMMNLPDDMFKKEMLPYLSIHDIVKLDKACVNHKYRSKLLEKISGVILRGDEDKAMKASLFEWLGMRRIYLINIEIAVHDLHSYPSIMEIYYVDQFRYTQNVFMRGAIRDDFAVFIVSNCPCLLSIDILCDYDDHQVTDHTLLSIAEHCTGIQSISLSKCHEISDTGLISISEHCPNLLSFRIDYCEEMTDASIISISTHCTGLKSLNLECCPLITDASIISISTHCTGLRSLLLFCCNQITDASIISISENCTGFQELTVSGTYVTDASLIAIAKNCIGLKALYTYGCMELSSYKLRSTFKTVSDLRAALLSIYPFIPI